MNKRYSTVLIVLITPLLLVAGCVHAPAILRSKKPTFDSRAAESEDAASMPDASVLDPNTQASQESAYFADPVDSQDLVAVDLESNRAVNAETTAPNSIESPVVLADAQETADISILALPTTHEGPEIVEFASAAALKDLDVTVLKEPSDAPLLDVAESNQVVQTGCCLFGENPPLRRECVDLGLGTISSVIHPCGMKYLAPYVDRVPDFDEPPARSGSTDHGVMDPSCPPAAWWEQQVVTPVRPASNSIAIDIESLIVRTLANSKYLQGLADLPLIREKSTMEAIAEFDATTFMESHFRRPSDPVGNQLTVGPGGSPRFRENDFATSAGIGRKTSYGGRVKLAQEIGLLTNNSEFLDPRHQGNSRLTLNITQPLLSGSGKRYNTSLIMLAQMDEHVARDEVSAQLQDYLVEVMENYWQLYLERSRFEQKQRHVQRGEAILAELEQRREIDAVDSQIARARAAVQTRRTELIRAKTQIRNVESRLRGLVNDPTLYGHAIELVPAEIPQCNPLELSLGDAMSQALQSRSEIDKAIQKVRAAGVRLSVAKNELLPILDVVLETYLSGLRGGNNIGRAWTDQFSVGEPSYSAGIQYEIPLHNRLAKNRHQRRRLEMRQSISQFEFQVEELMSEVDIAVREVNTTYEEMLSRHEAMVANEIDLSYFHKRWELLPGDDRSASFLLEDILEAQDRVAAEESNFAQAQVNYVMSIVKLKRALGILIQTERIETGRICDCGLERFIFSKQPSFDVPLEQATTESMMHPDMMWIESEQLPPPERSQPRLEPFSSSDDASSAEPRDEPRDEPSDEPSDDASVLRFSSEGLQMHSIEAPVAVENMDAFPLTAPAPPAP